MGEKPPNPLFPDLSRMLAIVKIDETDVPSVAVGQEVEIMPEALTDSTFRGKVVRVGLMPLTTQLSTETPRISRLRSKWRIFPRS
jgi:multidrug resistance efflux pump